jgi:hypothetical protein
MPANGKMGFNSAFKGLIKPANSFTYTFFVFVSTEGEKNNFLNNTEQKAKVKKQ